MYSSKQLVKRNSTYQFKGFEMGPNSNLIKGPLRTIIVYLIIIIIIIIAKDLIMGMVLLLASNFATTNNNLLGCINLNFII